MALRLFRRRRPAFWDPGESPIPPERRGAPDLVGRRAFLAEHVLLHTHVPKAGGSALAAGLSAIVGGIRTMDLRLARGLTLDALSPAELDELSLVSGHVPYGLHARFDRVPLYVASVREPVARAVSAYRFLQEHTDHGDNRYIEGRDFNSAWDALREAKGPQGDNVQARMLTGETKAREIAEDALWPQVEEAYFLVIPQPEITRALQRLRGAFGVAWTRIPRINVSRSPGVDVSTDMRTRILAANRLDTELYARVREDFDSHLERACDYIASRCLLPLKGGDS